MHSPTQVRALQSLHSMLGSNVDLCLQLKVRGLILQTDKFYGVTTTLQNHLTAQAHLPLHPTSALQAVPVICSPGNSLLICFLSVLAGVLCSTSQQVMVVCLT